MRLKAESYSTAASIGYLMVFLNNWFIFYLISIFIPRHPNEKHNIILNQYAPCLHVDAVRYNKLIAGNLESSLISRDQLIMERPVDFDIVAGVGGDDAGQYRCLLQLATCIGGVGDTVRLI